MAWNEPGGGGRDPWNAGKRGDGIPDVEELLKRLRARFGAGRSGSRPGGFGAGGFWLLAAAVLALWSASGFYSIDAQERGVVLRFGRYVGDAEPGLRWRIPWPVERVWKVNVTQVRTAKDEGTMLTRDMNIVAVEFNVSYQVSSAKDFVLNARDPDGTLRQAMPGVMREIVGRNDMAFVRISERDVGERVKQSLQAQLDRYRSGLRVTEVNIRQTQPPEPVQKAFDDAARAGEEQQSLKDKAEAYAEDRLPRARGDAARQLADAGAYHDRVIAQAQGDAAHFTALLAEYRKAPKLTRQRLYLDAMDAVLSSVTKIIVDTDKGQPLIYLPLDKMLQPGAPPGEEGTSKGAPGEAKPPGEARAAPEDERSRDRERRR